MRAAGVDEAGLGPRLGPFCAALVEIDLSRGDPHGCPDVYGLLRNAVSGDVRRHRDDEGAPAVIGDSKSLYSPRRGIGLLEHGVLILLRAMGVPPPQSLRAWVRAFCPGPDAAALNDVPWFARRDDDVSIPLARHAESRIEGKSRVLLDAMHSAGLKLLPPKQRFVTAAGFNRALDSEGGKSPAVRSILDPLIVRAVRGKGPDHRCITVDRQGGRRYYAEWLTELFPDRPPKIHEETPSYSRYSIGHVRISFPVSADRLHFEVAAASMFAKYLRELGMMHFNRWWSEKAGGIEPTAGYPRDAERFVNELRAAGSIPVSESMLIRNL